MDTNDEPVTAAAAGTQAEPIAAAAPEAEVEPTVLASEEPEEEQPTEPRAMAHGRGPRIPIDTARAIAAASEAAGFPVPAQLQAQLDEADTPAAAAATSEEA